MAQAVTSSGVLGGGRYQARDALPIGEINTTPLIDVMLVLLIMFIITVPTQTHQVKMNLPQHIEVPDDWIRPLRNNLTMTAAGDLRWNDRQINDAQLAALLAEVAAMPKPPEVHFRPDAKVHYERVDEVLVIAARSGASTFGFAGNEQYRDSF